MGVFFSNFPSFVATGYLYQIGVEFHQKVIGAIVNLPTPKQRTLRGPWAFLRVFLAFFLTSLVLVLQKVIGPIVNLASPTWSSEIDEGTG